MCKNHYGFGQTASVFCPFFYKPITIHLLLKQNTKTRNSYPICNNSPSDSNGQIKNNRLQHRMKTGLSNGPEFLTLPYSEQPSEIIFNQKIL
ncbi:hypothetical protein CMU20_11155 [Elizabethkingia anophelis]|nr:hypothetical protein [Elizabethkingia anophelis]